MRNLHPLPYAIELFFTSSHPCPFSFPFFNLPPSHAAIRGVEVISRDAVMFVKRWRGSTIVEILIVYDDVLL